MSMVDYFQKLSEEIKLTLSWIGREYM
ncbi:hypothetical protein AB3S75_023254 [Citrus x aurantiifolia]